MIKTKRKGKENKGAHVLRTLFLDGDAVEE